MSTKLKSILIQAIAGYGITAIGLIQGLFLLPFYLKYIDLATYGSWLTIYSILNMMMLINFGINDFTISQMSKDFANQKFARLYGIFRTSIIAYIALGIFYFFISLIILQFLEVIIKLNDYTLDLKVCILAAGLGGSFTIINQGLIDFSNATLKPFVPAICKFFSQLVGIFITVFIMLTQHSIIAIPVGMLLAEAITLIILSLYTSCQILKFNLKGPKHNFTIIELLRVSPAMFGATIGNKIIEEFPNILISRNFGVENVAIYSITKKIADILIKIIRISVIAFLPAASNVVAITNHQKQRIFLNQVLSLFCMFIFIIFSIYQLFNENFILLWMSVNIKVDADLITFLAISTALFSILEVLKYLHYAKESYNVPAFITFITGIVFGVLLVPALEGYGVNGAPKLLFFIMLISVCISYLFFNEKTFIIPDKIIFLKLSILTLAFVLISNQVVKVDATQTWLHLISSITLCMVIFSFLFYVNFKSTFESILCTLTQSTDR